MADTVARAAPEPVDARYGAALVLDEVACARGGRTLFEGLSLTLAPGEALRLVGPNGSGKTSLLRLLAGLLPPAGGRLSLSDAASDRPIRQRAHLLSHLDAIKPSLTVEGALTFWAAYLGGSPANLRGTLARVGLAHVTSARCGDLSAGQRRRLALARILALPRPLWLLDEPTAALDADGQRLLEALIAEHRAAGGLVVAATHLPLALPGARTLRLELRLDMGS